MTYAKRIVTIFKGAVSMAQIMDDNSYIRETTDLIDHIIANQIKL